MTKESPLSPKTLEDVPTAGGGRTRPPHGLHQSVGTMIATMRGNHIGSTLRQATVR
ncbi:MAG: hypothetical protein NT113_04315 [Hyphomicrobiales bacterium]|jgi:hypothetical protein|nr:hypothetical protein [Hyphomicrobiales bacterium]